MNEWPDKQIGEKTDEQTERYNQGKHRQTDRWTDGQNQTCSFNSDHLQQSYIKASFVIWERPQLINDIQLVYLFSCRRLGKLAVVCDGQTDGQTDRQMDRLIGEVEYWQSGFIGCFIGLLVRFVFSCVYV